MGIQRASILALSGCILFAIGFADAEENNAAREQRLRQLEGLSVQEAFETLTSPEFSSEEEYMDQGIGRAFGRRTGQAIKVALGYVSSSQVQDSPEKFGYLYAAKRIIQVFPDKAQKDLLDLYASGDPKIRKNVIFVVGGMAGEEPFRTLLVKALEDETYCQERLDEMVGEPLRICDVAYNQLVSNQNIKGVLRTIGSVHKIEIRNYYIKKLKETLKLT